MTAPEATSTSIKKPDLTPRASWREGFAVYLQRRVLIVLLLGFSSGLPLALSGSTLLVWMRESGVDLGTIGLFALVGTPYTLKFLWAPLVDALHVPFFTRAFGRRHGILRRGLPHRHAGLDRGRAVHGERVRINRYRARLGVDVGLCGDGSAGADRHGHGAIGHRARAIGARGGRDARRDRIRARDPCRDRRILRVSRSQGCAR